jgi:hypothetical protein
LSQIYKPLTSSGPIPPIIPTQFTADDGNIAIPAANNLNVFSRDTIENNANGIQTTADPNASDNLFVEFTNRISITAVTSDGGGQTQTVTLFTPANATAVNFECNFIGYDLVNNEAAGGDQQGLARKSAGTVVVVGTNDSFDQSDLALATVDWNVIASGGDLVAEFVGVAGRTINWTATFSYNQTS